MSETNARRSAAATARNREPILAVLRRVLPPAGLVLEIASGTGEHACFFAGALPALTWQPTDLDAGNRASIAAWRDEAALPNLLRAARARCDRGAAGPSSARTRSSTST